MLAERLLTPLARRARPAGRRVGRHEPPARGDVDPADLVPERARRRSEKDGVAAAVRLEVCAVRERDLDLEKDFALGGSRVGHLLEA